MSPHTLGSEAVLALDMSVSVSPTNPGESPTHSSGPNR